MATSTGKQMRKTVGGNRYSLKRRTRRAKHVKDFTNNAMDSAAYWRQKRA